MNKKLTAKIISILVASLTLMPLNTYASYGIEKSADVSYTQGVYSDESVSTGTTYYVSDEVTLNESILNGGKSEDKPISLLYLDAFIGLKAGDTVKFKNGSKFNQDIAYNVITENPDEKQRVTFTNYRGADGSEELPQFSLYKMTDDPSLWTADEENKNLWYIDFSNPDCQYKGYRGCLDYAYESLDLNAKKAYNSIGYIYNPENDQIYANGKTDKNKLENDYEYCSYYDEKSKTNRLYVYCHENPNASIKELYFADAHPIFNLRSNTNIYNLKFNLCGGHVISNNFNSWEGRETNNVTINGCEIDMAGGSFTADGFRAGNGIEFMTSGNNIEIIGNSISNCYDTAITLQGVNGNWHNVNIQQNKFMNNSQSFEVWSSVTDSSEHKMTEVRFENNLCMNQGRGWGSTVRPDKQKACDIEIQHMDITNADIKINNNTFFNPVRLMYLNLTEDKYVNGFKNNVIINNNNIYLRDDASLLYRDEQENYALLDHEPYLAKDYGKFASRYSAEQGDKKIGNRVASIGAYESSDSEDIKSILENYVFEDIEDETVAEEVVTEGLNVSQLADNGENGVITGLEPEKKYAYKLRNDSEYIKVDEGASEITGLKPGVYDIRCTSDENSSETFTMTVREKSAFNEYITSEDMKAASVPNTSSLNFSNDERIKKVIKKAEESDQPINILLIGGSITYGYGSRTYVPVKNESYGIEFSRWLQKVFPEREVRTYDIGIPSSHSPLANARIDYELSKYNPDIVFIDFAVNDGGADWDTMHYESLLRKILNSGTEPAVMLPMFSFFDQHTGMGQYSVTDSVHCEIGSAYNLPMMRYGRVMQSVLDRIGNGDKAYELIKALGYSYNQSNMSGDLVHPGDEGHKMMAQFYEDYFEKVLNEYQNNDKKIDDSKIAFDGTAIRSNKYDDEILLNADTLVTTASALQIKEGKTEAIVDNFKWYRVVPDKCAYPYYDDVNDDGGAFIECDTLPCWESRTADSSLTFTNIKGKSIGVWCYYHLTADSSVALPQHYIGQVQGTLHIEMTDKDGNTTTLEKPMPVPDYNNWENTSPYAMYIRLYGEGDNSGSGTDYIGSNIFEDANSKNDVQKKFETIKIQPVGDNPNIQILGLVVSGMDN